MTIRKPIKWNESKFTVGDADLDQQHKRIVELINQLSFDAINQFDAEVVTVILEDLLRYSEEHLKFEESLLQKAGYSDFQARQELHWEYLERVSGLSFSKKEVAEKDVEKIVEFLSHWWEHHILVEDKKFIEIFN